MGRVHLPLVYLLLCILGRAAGFAHFLHKTGDAHVKTGPHAKIPEDVMVHTGQDAKDMIPGEDMKTGPDATGMIPEAAMKTGPDVSPPDAAMKALGPVVSSILKDDILKAEEEAADDFLEDDFLRAQADFERAEDNSTECGNFEDFIEPSPPGPPPHLEIFPRMPPYVDYCGVLKAEMVPQPTRIKFSAAKEGLNYILVMVDADLRPAPYVHWIIANLPGMFLNTIAGIPVNRWLPNVYEILVYMPPAPPGEQHRFQFMLYEQEELLNTEVGSRIWYQFPRTPFSNYVLLDDLEDDKIINKTRPVAYWQYSAYEREGTECLHAKDYDWEKCMRCEDIKMQYSSVHNCTEFVENLVHDVEVAAEFEYPKIFSDGHVPDYMQGYKKFLRQRIFDTFCHVDWTAIVRFANGDEYRCGLLLQAMAIQLEHKATKSRLFTKDKFGAGLDTKFVRPLCSTLCIRVEQYFNEFLKNNMDLFLDYVNYEY